MNVNIAKECMKPTTAQRKNRIYSAVKRVKQQTEQMTMERGLKMIKGKFGQARCSACGSWHFAIQLDDNLNATEYKCCKCGRLIPVKHYVKVEPKVEEQKK